MIGTSSPGRSLLLATKRSDAWELRYEELTNYKAQNGDCNVPTKQGPLGRWVNNQRQSYKKGKLSQESIDLLESIGFVWDLLDEAWTTRFDELVDFKNENGDCNVPTNQGPLGEWVCRQRQSYKRENLSRERVDLLESVGFSWEPTDEAWATRFDELVGFKNENGDCNVPKAQGPLGMWVSTQRYYYKKGELSQERLDLLESVGFVWESFDEAWMSRFDELAGFKNENGDCNVPYRHGSLGSWVFTQRSCYKNGKMSQERIRLLETIGFEWFLRERTVTKPSWKLDEQWKTSYTELVQYLTEHGSCNVPQKYGPLGRWVFTQRKTYKDGSMMQFRVDYLDSIGFVWTTKRVGKEWLPNQYSEPDPKAIARIIEEEKPQHDDLPASATEELKTRVKVGRWLAEALHHYLDKLEKNK